LPNEAPLTAPTEVTARAGRHLGRLACQPALLFPTITTLGHPGYPSASSARAGGSVPPGRCEAMIDRPLIVGRACLQALRDPGRAHIPQPHMVQQRAHAAPDWCLETAWRDEPAQAEVVGAVIVSPGEGSADEVGGDRPQQQRPRLGPHRGRRGRDDDAGAGPALDQAGDLLVVVGADPGHVVVDEA
jgi:hypothetical protein